MRRPYKYPYLTIFILGYYWLEHEGYYYKIRNWLGYGKVDEPTFVLTLVPDTFKKISSAPDRQVLLLSRSSPTPDLDEELRKAAKKAKERKQSPVLFAALDCSQYSSYCQEAGLQPSVQLTYFRSGQAIASFPGPFSKAKILKFLKKCQNLPSPSTPSAP